MDPIVNIIRKLIGAQVCGMEYSIEMPFTEEELQRMYHLSCVQDVAHLVASELEKQHCLDQSTIAEKFRHRQMLAVFRYQRIQYELDEICRILEKEQIPHIPLKGAILRQYYPEPWMRTSADIDLLVHPKQLEQATNCLVKQLEYRSEGTSRHDVQMFAPSGVHLELHFDTVEEKRAGNANQILTDIWNYAIPEQGFQFRYALSDDLFYFYHIAHMAKHFETGGCGLRFFLDLWLLNHRKEFDLSKRTALLDQGGLLVFEQAAKDLSEVWFSNKEHSDMSQKMETYVLESGLYGSNDHSVAIKQIKKGSSLKYSMGLIFLPYSAIKKMYPICEKHPILFPFCQIARWFRLIFGGRMKDSIKKLNHSQEIGKNQKDQINNLLTELGLEAAAGT